LSNSSFDPKKKDFLLGFFLKKFKENFIDEGKLSICQNGNFKIK